MESRMGNRRAIQTIVLIGVFMSVLDSVIVSVALPNITQYFRVSISSSQWVMTTYPLVETALLIVFGKLAERTGKAWMFTGGLIVFTLSSLACGLSTSLEELIAFRIVQGIGASMLFSISVAIIFETSPHEERGRRMGIMGGVVAVASMVGPAMGGFIVGSLGWEFIFFVNVPIGLVSFAIALKVMKWPEVRVRNKFDLTGTVLWVVSVTSLLIMIGQISNSGSFDLMAMAWAVLMVSTLAGFIIWERRSRSPLLDITVFHIRRFSLACTSMTMFFVTTTMVTILAPFYFEGVLGYSPEQVGIFLIVIPAVMMIGSPLIGRAYDRSHWRHFTMTGHMLRGISYFLLAFAFLQENIYLIVASFFLIGIGGSLFQSPNNIEVMATLPREKTGVASSITATARNLGISLGPAIATLLLVLQLGPGVGMGGFDPNMAADLTNASAVALTVAGMISMAGAVISWSGNRTER